MGCSDYGRRCPSTPVGSACGDATLEAMLAGLGAADGALVMMEASSPPRTGSPGSAALAPLLVVSCERRRRFDATTTLNVPQLFGFVYP